MFCSKCGRELPEDSQFCSQCGRALATPASKSWTARPSVWIAVGLGVAVIAVLAWWVATSGIQYATRAKNLRRARIPMNEASAIGSLRELNTTAVTYSTTYGGYPPNLRSLGPGSPATSASANLIDSDLASGTKDGYVFNYSAGTTDASDHVLNYSVTAQPLTVGVTGQRYFYTDQSGMVRSDATAPASSSSVPTGTAITARMPASTEDVPEASRSLSTQDIYQMASGATALIETFDDEGHKRGQGSGFLVSADGTVLTNYHVIRGATSVTAKFGDSLPSDVLGILGYGSTRDVAVIKIASPPQTVLQLGDSDNVTVGEKVVTVGSPIGLQNTVSEGIVSGIRDGRIQMTDPISPGSSGGPVLDAGGNVVGMSVAFVAAGENLNFAVPINWAKPYLIGGNPRPLTDVAAENAVVNDIFDSSITLPPRQMHAWNINVNPNVMSNAEVDGTISSSGGVDGLITVALYYKNALIYSCRATSCEIRKNLVNPGTYILTLDNRASQIFGRTVTGEISLRYVK
jgi:S1-C subfamily serine protease